MFSQSMSDRLLEGACRIRFHMTVTANQESSGKGAKWREKGLSPIRSQEATHGAPAFGLPVWRARQQVEAIHWSQSDE